MNSGQARIPSIIVVEDNETLRDELVCYLADEGFVVRGVDTGESLNQALQEKAADLLILDLNLPEEDGLSITRRICRALPGMGIIMLTARVRGADRLEGYACGADVYLTKPTRPEELVAVVRKLFARLDARAAPPRWLLDMASLSLDTPQGKRIGLTASEARLLKELAINGQFLSHEALYLRFGEETQPDKVNKGRLEVLVSRLRSKLSPHVGEGTDIRAVRGQGYQLGFAVELRNLAVG